jgi:hypothetical protein
MIKEQNFTISELVESNTGDYEAVVIEEGFQTRL